MHTKASLRSYLLKKRLQLTQQELQALSRRVEENLKRLLRELSPKSVMLYWPIKGEPDLTPLARELLENGVKLYFPKVLKERIAAVEVDNLDQLSPGAFNIPEPPYSPQREGTPEAVVVPALGYDKKGYRLGYGGGYYDRFLASAPVKDKIGVCFHFQLLDAIPVEPFDQPVDWIVTDKTTLRRT
ncbi:5-formyltetrahydrofolate cyclo-ligase [Thermovibrio ammonificans HB-1]|uniref:5-formyltetrahydrofolate cyclo-ligase n=1 Tax=Thermovibrio ammonificans (strain DSM 15698 / JCM 12110 / HB-1) TaxID=648996 RepID=E8T2W1_THEA1|nr:5-formyltetrahydrofolate cyclo-ligase [Thermovibrio ammonificans]ADU97170.1 5-formyltetrahydrofolate cyclo-ligase [Thermovibrio ammonificans HB-1]